MMKASPKSLVFAAAVSGLLGGTMARVNAAPHSGAKAFAGHLATQFDGKDTKKDKHACKGKNDCKGKGGCSSGDNGCAGKNSCKGKGGCATDGSKKS